MLVGGSRLTSLDETGKAQIDERQSRSTEVSTARQVLAILDELEAGHHPPRGVSRELPARALFDPRLLAAKAVLKYYPAVRVRCEKGHQLDWIGLAPYNDHGLQLVHGPKLVPPRQRTGGFAIMSGSRGNRAAYGTATFVEDAAAGVGNVKPRPDGPYGDVFGLKCEFTCPKCGLSHVTLHVTLLRLWAEAVIENSREIRLGAPWGSVSDNGVERVADRGSARAYATRHARRP